MKLRDLFRWRSDAPDPPAPAPARRPDWPAMRPVQRVISAPDLITAPDRFTDNLVSWRNPSRGGTLGHYVTPDAPTGVSEGLVATSPRDELPAPARPWWWPRPPAVQRRVPTSSLVPELNSSVVHSPPNSSDGEFGGLGAPGSTPSGSTGHATVVAVRPLAGQTLVSAAGAEPLPPRVTMPVVQRAPEDPASVPDPSIAAAYLPVDESPPETPLPSVVEPRTEPALEASAGITITLSPGSRSDLPVARRLGLGAPLQRVPGAAAGTSTERATKQSPIEVGTEPAARTPLVSHVGGEPMEETPLVSHSASMAPVAGAPSSMRSNNPGLPVQRALDTPRQPEPHLVELPSTEPTAATTPLPTAAATGDESPTMQRQVEAGVEPMEAAPLVFDSGPIASVTGSPMSAGPMASPPMASPPAATPSAEPTRGSDSAQPRPAPGSSARSREPGLPVQRALDTPLRPEPHPVELPSTEPPAAAAPLPAAAPTGDESPTMQRQVEAGAEPMEEAPLVSDSGPIASVTGSPRRSGSAEPHTVLDTPLPPGPHPVELPSTEPAAATATTPLPTAAASAGGGQPTPLQRESSEVDHTEGGRTVAEDSVAPAVVGLVGNRPIELVVTDHPTADSAGVPGAAPAAKQTRSPSVHRSTTVEGQVTGAYPPEPRVPAATAVQRSMGVGARPAAPWPPGALAASRSSPPVDGQAAPAQLVQFAGAAPVAAESRHSPLSTTLVVQRADDASEPAAVPSPKTATSLTEATTAAPPVGSTAPIEVDSLVRRLYDPIVRLLKAELQLDRERAGHSLDLRH